MKILIIFAPLIEEGYLSGKEKMLPLGVSYLASYLRQHGHVVKLNIGNIAALDADIKEFVPDLIGISSMTPSFPAAVAMAEKIKAVNNVPVILGGQHASSMPEDILKNYKCFDYIIYGEGEETFTELTGFYEEGRNDFQNIDGLVWRKDYSEVIVNKCRKNIEDIDKITFPAWDLFDRDTIKASHRHLGFKKAFPLISSRGCPFSCSFCSSHLTMGRQLRMHSVAYVLDAIEKINRGLGINNIIFWDDVFTLLPERLEKFCSGLLRRNIRINWYCLSRVDNITSEMARLMKKAGCTMVSIGVESGNQDILKKIGKQINIKTAEEAVKIFKASGIRVQATFILGFPFDNYETIRDTIEFAKKLSPTIALFFRLVPYPGTEILKYIRKEYLPVDVKEWEYFVASGKDKIRSFSPGFSDSEMQSILKEAYRKFYFRPRQIFEILKSVKSINQLAGYMHSLLPLIKLVR